jgi:multidrug efflux pump subunit AcrA (membrane-fusion protein)
LVNIFTNCYHESMTVDSTHDVSLEGEAWQEFEETMAEIALLARSDRPLSEFSSALLEHILQLLAAVGGAVWLTDSEGNLQLDAQVSLDSLYSSISPFSVESHDLLLKQVLNSGDLTFLPPNLSNEGGCSNLQTTDYLLVLCPIKIDHDVVGLIEVIQRATTNSAELRGHRRLMSMIMELVSNHMRRREIARLRQCQSESNRFEQFAHKAHSTIDLRTAGFELSNEGRRFIGCDRVSVMIRRGRKYRLLASSGVDSVNRRSNTVRHMEKLATGIARFGLPYMSTRDALDLPPQLEELVQRYVDQSQTTALVVVPMQLNASKEGNQEGAIVGILIAEQFSAGFDQLTEQRIMQMASHSSLALKNAITFQALLTLPFARSRACAKIASGSSRKWKTMVFALATCSCMIVALITVPMDFNVAVRGELQPQKRSEVFAPFDGEISSLSVSHGDTVVAGDDLLVLRSPQIELDYQRVHGEYDTARKRLLAVESALLQYNPGDEAMQSGQSRQAAELEAIKQQLNSQRAQLQLLQEQQAKLLVDSPIGGMVLTWDLHQLLDNRPVQRGQSMLTIADLSGSWIAELEIPDDRIGFVLQEKKDSGAPPRISFELATSRGTLYRGILGSISSRTDLTDEEIPVVRATANLEGVSFPEEVRPGSTIFAKIHCGKKPVGYVWLHDLYHAIQSWVLF